MTIKALTVRDKKTNELIDAIGIEEGATVVILNIEEEFFSEKELQENDGASPVFHTECEAYYHAKEYENIVIAVEDLEVK